MQIIHYLYPQLAYRQVQRENEDELREIKQEISEKQSENLKLDYVISYKRDKLKEYDDEISKWEQFKNRDGLRC